MNIQKIYPLEECIKVEIKEEETYHVYVFNGFMLAEKPVTNKSRKIEKNKKDELYKFVKKVRNTLSNYEWDYSLKEKIDASIQEEKDYEKEYRRNLKDKKTSH